MSDLEEHGSDWEDGINEEDEAVFDWNSGSEIDDPQPQPSTSQGSTRKGKQNKKRTPVGRCHVCSKSYFTHDSYKNHVKTHFVEELFSTKPANSVVFAECRRSARSVLEEMELSKVTVGLGGDVKKIASQLCAEEDELLWDFVDEATKGILKCVPKLSKISVQNFNSKYVAETGSYLNEPSNRNLLLNALKSLVNTLECSEDSLIWFVNRFFDKLALLAEAFILSLIKTPLESLCINYDYVDDRDKPEDLDFQQTVYYIGGSCIKSIFRLGRKKSDSKWINIIECVKKNLLAGELVGKPDCDIVAWTETLDRGGLQFVNEKVWCFLMAFSGVLKSIELPDGNVNPARAIECVTEDAQMMMFWKEIVENALSEEESQILLQSLCSFFINAWGKGIERRRLNAISGRVEKGQVALRSALAR